MKKLLLLSFTGIAVLMIALYIFAAIAAKKKSDEIMSKFKDVNEELEKANQELSLENDKAAANLGSVFSVSSMNNEVILLIDSLKEAINQMPVAGGVVRLSPQIESNSQRLILKIQTLNKLKWDMPDSRIPDTIGYWTGKENFDMQKWYAMHFLKQKKNVILNYLDVLKDQAINNIY